MAYNEDLDKTVWYEDREFEGGSIRAAVCSYNNGPLRVQIGPRIINGKISRLGRMTAQEYVWFISLTPKISDILGLNKKEEKKSASRKKAA